MNATRTFLSAVFALALGAIAFPGAAAPARAPGAVTIAQFDAQMPLFQAGSWNVVEDGGWNAVWTFDAGRRTMSGVWINRSNGQSVTVPRMRVQQQGQQIVIRRPGLGNYVGTIDSSGTSISGTLSWSSGRFSAGIAAPPQAEIGRLPLFAANSWNVSEDGGWNAVWTFDRGHRTMSGVWTNTQTGQRARSYGMFVRQEGQQIVVARPGLGNYVGTISSDGTSMSGTLSWSSGHFGAQIR
jgi:hypothetical protein